MHSSANKTCVSVVHLMTLVTHGSGKTNFWIGSEKQKWFAFEHGCFHQRLQFPLIFYDNWQGIIRDDSKGPCETTIPRYGCNRDTSQAPPSWSVSLGHERWEWAQPYWLSLKATLAVPWLKPTALLWKINGWCCTFWGDAPSLETW